MAEQVALVVVVVVVVGFPGKTAGRGQTVAWTTEGTLRTAGEKVGVAVAADEEAEDLVEDVLVGRVDSTTTTGRTELPM